ncbi:hypothetical protein Pcinc_022522 [Petrolisthes cinctipes]|uniref:Uncharacterized protein n=1 Tax=Petrolisthes cinctipes TaxID=88211 RepID=A0AAE1KI57_PETCI|nr:hypothetical protein Pcinc_022522 [Petrolisthes cinctipes]
MSLITTRVLVIMVLCMTGCGCGCMVGAAPTPMSTPSTAITNKPVLFTWSWINDETFNTQADTPTGETSLVTQQTTRWHRPPGYHEATHKEPEIKDKTNVDIVSSEEGSGDSGYLKKQGIEYPAFSENRDNEHWETKITNKGKIGTKSTLPYLTSDATINSNNEDMQTLIKHILLTHTTFTPPPPRISTVIPSVHPVTQDTRIMITDRVPSHFGTTDSRDYSTESQTLGMLNTSQTQRVNDTRLETETRSDPFETREEILQIGSETVNARPEIFETGEEILKTKSETNARAEIFETEEILKTKSETKTRPKIFDIRSETINARPDPETRPETFNVRPETFETRSEMIKITPETISARPETINMRPDTFKTRPNTTWTRPTTLQDARPETTLETTYTRPQTFETRPQTIPETIRTKPETFETIPQTTLETIYTRPQTKLDNTYYTRPETFETRPEIISTRPTTLQHTRPPTTPETTYTRPETFETTYTRPQTFENTYTRPETFETTYTRPETFETTYTRPQTTSMPDQHTLSHLAQLIREHIDTLNKFAPTEPQHNTTTDHQEKTKAEDNTTDQERTEAEDNTTTHHHEKTEAEDNTTDHQERTDTEDTLNNTTTDHQERTEAEDTLNNTTTDHQERTEAEDTLNKTTDHQERTEAEDNTTTDHQERTDTEDTLNNTTTDHQERTEAEDTLNKTTDHQERTEAEDNTTTDHQERTDTEDTLNNTTTDHQERTEAEDNTTDHQERTEAEDTLNNTTTDHQERTDTKDTLNEFAPTKLPHNTTDHQERTDTEVPRSGVENGVAGLGVKNGVAGLGVNNGVAGSGVDNGMAGLGVENGVAGSGVDNGMAGLGVENGGSGLENGMAGSGVENETGTSPHVRIKTHTTTITQPTPVMYSTPGYLVPTIHHQPQSTQHLTHTTVRSGFKISDVDSGADRKSSEVPRVTTADLGNFTTRIQHSPTILNTGSDWMENWSEEIGYSDYESESRGNASDSISTVVLDNTDGNTWDVKEEFVTAIRPTASNNQNVGFNRHTPVSAATGNVNSHVQHYSASNNTKTQYLHSNQNQSSSIKSHTKLDIRNNMQINSKNRNHDIQPPTLHEVPKSSIPAIPWTGTDEAKALQEPNGSSFKIAEKTNPPSTNPLSNEHTDKNGYVPDACKQEGYMTRFFYIFSMLYPNAVHPCRRQAQTTQPSDKELDYTTTPSPSINLKGQLTYTHQENSQESTTMQYISASSVQPTSNPKQSTVAAPELVHTHLEYQESAPTPYGYSDEHNRYSTSYLDFVRTSTETYRINPSTIEVTESTQLLPKPHKPLLGSNKVNKLNSGNTGFMEHTSPSSVEMQQITKNSDESFTTKPDVTGHMEFASTLVNSEGSVQDPISSQSWPTNYPHNEPPSSHLSQSNFSPVQHTPPSSHQGQKKLEIQNVNIIVTRRPTDALSTITSQVVRNNYMENYPNHYSFTTENNQATSLSYPRPKYNTFPQLEYNSSALMFSPNGTAVDVRKVTQPSVKDTTPSEASLEEKIWVRVPTLSQIELDSSGKHTVQTESQVAPTQPSHANIMPQDDHESVSAQISHKTTIQDEPENSIHLAHEEPMSSEIGQDTRTPKPETSSPVMSLSSSLWDSWYKKWQSWSTTTSTTTTPGTIKTTTASMTTPATTITLSTPTLSVSKTTMALKTTAPTTMTPSTTSPTTTPPTTSTTSPPTTSTTTPAATSTTTTTITTTRPRITTKTPGGLGQMLGTLWNLVGFGGQTATTPSTTTSSSTIASPPSTTTTISSTTPTTTVSTMTAPLTTTTSSTTTTTIPSTITTSSTSPAITTPLTATDITSSIFRSTPASSMTTKPSLIPISDTHFKSNNHQTNKSISRPSAATPPTNMTTEANTNWWTSAASSNSQEATINATMTTIPTASYSTAEHSISKAPVSEETNHKKHAHNLLEVVTRPEEHTTEIPLYTIHNLTTIQPLIKMYFPTTVNKSLPSTPATLQSTGEEWESEATTTTERVTEVNQKMKEHENQTVSLHSRKRVRLPLQSLENLFHLIGTLRGQVGKTNEEEESENMEDTDTKNQADNTWHNVPYSLSSTLASMFPSLPNFFGHGTTSKQPDIKDHEYQHKLPQQGYHNPQSHSPSINGQFPHLPPRIPQRIDFQPFLKGQNHRNRYRNPPYHPGPTIIVKKDGARLHIPVMPSADFSSFKPQYNTRETLFKPRPQGDWKTGGMFNKNSRQNLKPKQRPYDTDTQRKIHKSNIIHISQFPPPEKFPHNPPFPHRLPPNAPFFPHKVPPNTPFFIHKALPNPLSPHISTPFSPSSATKRCKSTMLNRLGNLLNNNNNNHRFGVGVYSSVIESMSVAECGQNGLGPEEERERSGEGEHSTPTTLPHLPAPFTLPHLPTPSPLTHLSNPSSTLPPLPTPSPFTHLFNSSSTLPPLPTPSSIIHLFNSSSTLPSLPTPSPLTHLSNSSSTQPPLPIPFPLTHLSNSSSTQPPLPIPSPLTYLSTSSLLSPPPPSTTLTSPSSSTYLPPVSPSSSNLPNPSPSPSSDTSPSPQSSSSLPSSPSSSLSSNLLSSTTPSSVTSTNPPSSSLPVSSSSPTSNPNPSATSTSIPTTSSLPSLSLPSDAPPLSLLPLVDPHQPTAGRSTTSSSSSSSRSSTGGGGGGLRVRRDVRLGGVEGGTGVTALLLALQNSMVSATQSHHSTPESLTDPEMASPRAITPTIFGFETILTGLIYLSFGIFMYQMIQRAVDSRQSLMGNLSARDFDAGGDGEVMATVLDSLEKLPNLVAEVTLAGMKGSEVMVRYSPCLPLYLCHLNHHHNDTSTFTPTTLAALRSVIPCCAGMYSRGPKKFFPFKDALLGLISLDLC